MNTAEESIPISHATEGKPAATPDLLRAVRAFADRDPAGYAAVIRPLREQAELFVEELAAGRLNELLEVTRAYGAALAELGARADSPIVTPRFELASELALNLGGVAKPSGAGGGDVGIALFTDATAARTFSSRLTQLGMHPIDTGLDSGGVYRRVPTSSG